MRIRSPRRRDERGLALPSAVVGLSVVAVALAGVAYVATDETDADQEASSVERPTEPESSSSSAAPDPEPTRTPEPAGEPGRKKQQKEEPVQRSETYVVVFNNTNIAGLAGTVAGQAAGAGWQVVGSDNWVGTIPAPTVYFPPRLEEAGKMLARDLGIQRIMPAVEPMQFDRLTVILTGPV